jgi:hypothetical protein
MTHFYLTLPANSSLNYYPSNTLARYKTRLQSPIELTGEWELALVEIIFTKSWPSIPRDAGKMTLSCGSLLDGSVELNAPSGYYSSMDQLINYLNVNVDQKLLSHEFVVNDNKTTLKRVKLPEYAFPHFTYDELNRKVSVVLQPGASIKFDEHLCSMFGIITNPVANNTSTVQAIAGEANCDIEAGIHALYVYCDVAEHVVVGDTQAPLLRVVDATGKNGQNVYSTFDPPRYVPVRKKQFDSIEIDIRTDFGSHPSFMHGRVVCTLHFRRATFLP